MFILFITLSLSAGNIYCSDSNCSLCTQGFKYSNVACVLHCPEGSLKSDSHCEIGSQDPFIKLKFAEFLDYTAASISDFQHPLGLSFNNSGKLSPIPTKERGFYFASTSSLVSNRNWIIGPICFLHILVKIDQEGGIFKVGNSEIEHFYVYFANGHVNIDVLVYKNENEQIYTLRQTAIKGEWITFIFSSNLKLGLTEFQITNLPIQKLYKGEILPTPGLNFTIGGSFAGFIYELILGNTYFPYYAPNAFPPTCEFNQFYNNNLNTCQDCPSSCSDWPWCIRDSCNTCFSDQCFECDGLGLFDCLSCNNTFEAPYCESPINCLSGLLFNCTECQEGFIKSNGLCINTPIPYTDDSIYPAFNIKFEDITEIYGGFFQSGNDSTTFAPFNNQEIDDPYPVFKRGLYFNSTSNLQSIGLVSLNTSFTFACWAYFDNYELFSLLYSANLKITNFMLTFIRLSNGDENRTFVTRHFENTINTWKFWYVTVYFENSCQNVRTGADNLKVFGIFSSAGYGFYDFPNQLTIGAIKDSPISGFSGYIYQVILWQYSVFDFSQFIELCEGGGKTCLWEIGIKFYWNIYENKALECEKECYTGCKTWGTCSHCKSVLCESCDNYNSLCAESSKNTCLEGFLVNDELNCCSFECSYCYGTGNYRCLACNLGWVLNGNVCIRDCPSFFELNSGVCILLSPLVIDLEFDLISKDIVDSSNGIVFSTPSNSSIWPHEHVSDPIPAYKRGFYFNTSSYLNSDKFSWSYNLSLVFYMKLISPGLLVQKNELSLELNETYSTLQVNNAILSINPLPFSTWTVVIFQIFSNIDGYLTFSILNGTFKNTTSFYNYPIILNDSISSMEIGYKDKSFVGFLWKHQIYYSLKVFEGEVINVCLDDTQVNCVLDCEISQYIQNSWCLTCLSDCKFGCRDGESCGLCFSSECVSCESYTDCEFCPKNTEKVGSACSCVYGYEEYNGVCRPCGKYYLEHLCLDICPLGYAPENSNCSEKLPSGLALKFSFDSPSSVYKDTKSHLESLTNSLIPVYSRGTYFNSSASFISFPKQPKKILLFGLRFFTCLWLFPQTQSGSILTNSIQYFTQFRVYLQNSFLYSSISLKNSTLHLNSNLQLQQEKWSHLILSLDYSTTSGFSLYINGEQSYVINSFSYLFDQIGGNCQLGYSSDLDSFQGFIYSVESYVKFPEFSSLFSKSCRNCEICLNSGTCLWSCNVTNFYSDDIDFCENCNGGCTEGCRNANNCSVCADNECEICDTYQKKSCTQCKDGFELIDSTCQPCLENFYFDTDSKSCKNCTGLCETCKTDSICITCKSSSALNGLNVCTCILGFYGTTNCTRRKFNSLLTINTKNEAKIIFTEELAEELRASDIIVKIDNDIIVFSLKRIDGFTYKINLENIDIVKDSKLFIYYQKNLISVKNSLHDKEFIMISLYKQQKEQILESLKVFKQNTKSIFMSSIGGLIGVSILNFDPNCLYTFLNSAELFSYTVLYELDLDSDLKDFLVSIQVTSNLPSAFSLIPFEAGTISDSKLNTFGYRTNIICINSGFYLTFLIVLMLIHSLLYILSFVLPEKGVSVIKKCLPYFKYKLYLRFWLQTLFELFFGSIIGVKLTTFNSMSQIFNFILCLGILVFTI